MLVCTCNCGSVAFEIKAPLSDIYVCHCSICRRFSGGNGLPVVILKDEDFDWLSGHDDIRVWNKPDAEWQANFCCVCGSALPGKNDTGTMFVPAGLLPDDVGDLEVRHHIFVGLKAGWDVIGDAGKRHEGPFTA
ncbi:MAG: GFA family protein [Pseudomonadota bacterium]